MVRDDCIFCSIVAKKIPAAVVYEDTAVLAFLDIKPANKGHVLVIPKRHHASLDALPDDVLGKLFLAVKRVAKAVRGVTGCEGYNVLSNAGEAAGQVVLHAHVHIIPKFRIDSWKFNWPELEYDSEEMENLRKDIVSHMA